MMVWNMFFCLLQGCILRFHVNLPRCTSQQVIVHSPASSPQERFESIAGLLQHAHWADWAGKLRISDFKDGFLREVWWVAGWSVTPWLPGLSGVINDEWCLFFFVKANTLWYLGGAKDDMGWCILLLNKERFRILEPQNRPKSQGRWAIDNHVAAPFIAGLKEKKKQLLSPILVGSPIHGSVF